MICVSLSEPTATANLEALKNLEFAEIRMDKMNLTPEEVKQIFHKGKKLIATCRPGPHDDKTRETLLKAAIQAGASYVDVEIESSDAFKEAIAKTAKTAGCKVIMSYHNDSKTPDSEELLHIVRWCTQSGADIAKVACKANTLKDCARLLGLLDNERTLLVVGMGELGKIVRMVATFLGSPFTYASLREGKETAPGQIDQQKLTMVFETLNGV